MKRYFILVGVVLAACNIASAQGAKDSSLWLTEISKAREISDATGKPIFAFFTGSDWCAWCHKLEADVFAKPAFRQWASEQVVLLELDFPARKALPEHIVKQNQSLKSFFKVSGFPTIWLFCVNEDKAKENHFLIAPYGSLGYPKDPVRGEEEAKFIETANAILGSRTCQ